jgi:hypothetical protein
MNKNCSYKDQPSYDLSKLNFWKLNHNRKTYMDNFICLTDHTYNMTY